VKRPRKRPRKVREIKAGKVYGSLKAMREIKTSAKYPSQRYWRVQCVTCDAKARVQAGWLHKVAAPTYTRGTGCNACAVATKMPALNASLTDDQRREHSRLMHESMTAEERSERAAKGGRATAGKPRNRKPKEETDNG
jgi:hypothetical protein